MGKYPFINQSPALIGIKILKLSDERNTTEERKNGRKELIKRRKIRKEGSKEGRMQDGKEKKKGRK